jgi:hemoglobin
MKKEIQNRADVFLLVTQFYTKVRKDEILGPIFNNAIND